MGSESLIVDQGSPATTPLSRIFFLFFWCAICISVSVGIAWLFGREGKGIPPLTVSSVELSFFVAVEPAC